MKKYICSLLCYFSFLGLNAQALEKVSPESVGLDSKQFKYADEAINTSIKKGDIPGAVLAVVRHGKLAYLKAYGNKEVYPKKVAMTTNTIFDLASCSKPTSTAICVMKLIEQGKIRLIDPVNLYIPEFQNWKDSKLEETAIRIEDLLTHTSGLPPYANADELITKYGAANPNILMKYISTCKRDFAPKTNFQYSCLNFITLQHIIETVCGESLRTFSQKYIFEVLGMQYTDYIPTDLDKNGNWINTSPAKWELKNNQNSIIAPTEVQKNGQILQGQVHDPLARIMNKGISGNAGLFSCAEDLAILCATLQNKGEWGGHRILSPQTVKAMITVPTNVKKLGRTLGWDSYSDYASCKGDLLGKHTYCHTGYTGTSIVIDPDNDISIILLTNRVHPKDEHNVSRLRSYIANIIAASIKKQIEKLNKIK